MLIEAGQICLFIYFLLTSFNYTGNKTKIKKYNVTGQKDTQKKKKKNRKKGKWQMFIVKKKKNPSVSKCTKNIVELV